MHNLIQQQAGIDINFLPSLPATVSRILAITSDPESDAEDLIAAILPDQSMCAAIIVIGRAVFNAFPSLNREQCSKAALFWDHSFHSALLMMIIGESTNADPGEMFIAGLIHDIGKIPLLMEYPDEYLLIRNLDDPYYGEGEQALYKTTHSSIGATLTQKWLFPDIFIASTAFHHQPEKAGEDELYPALVHLTDAILLLTSQEEIAPQEIYPRLFSSIPETLTILTRHQIVVTPEKIEEWLEKVKAKAEESRQLLTLLGD